MKRAETTSKPEKAGLGWGSISAEARSRILRWVASQRWSKATDLDRLRARKVLEKNRRNRWAGRRAGAVEWEKK